MSGSPSSSPPASQDVLLTFGPFCLDRANARLSGNEGPVALTPKSFDVLHFLASRPDRLVSKDELLAAIWPDVMVSDASVKVCIREIRKALGDDAEAPRFIETVHRRGYRFIAPLGQGMVGVRDRPQQDSSTLQSPSESTSTVPFIGRSTEMQFLRAQYASALQGKRQCLFVTGGPGSGKTALIEAFLRSFESETAMKPHVLAGHCFEQFGSSEPYMPVWEAISRFGRKQAAPNALSALLERHLAHHTEPSVHVAAASSPASAPRAGSERLLREITDSLEAVATEHPVVLVLEDVHWADCSTLDLLSALARRRHAAAPLFVIATYRSTEVADTDHPLRGIVQSLLTERLCTELPLGLLDEVAVGEYLASRFEGCDFPTSLPRRLHQRTEGNPLFLVHVVDDLIEQGVVRAAPQGWIVPEASADSAAATCGWMAVLETQVPSSVRAMIELQLDRFTEREREVLEAAAVAGMEFSAAAVAAILAALNSSVDSSDIGDLIAAEQSCDALARRRRFLAQHGVAEWPDGTAATHYRFVHELYHNVVYERIPAARRLRMHRAVGLRMEEAWGNRAAEEAAMLSMHFEAGRDWPRAIRHLRQAAASADRQYAHREAIRYHRRAMAILPRLSSAERDEHELPLLMSLGVNLQITDGFAAPEFREVYARALELCDQRKENTNSTFPVLWGIWMFHKVRSELRPATKMAERLLTLADQSGDVGLQVQAHQAMCNTQLCLGNPRAACEHMERVVALYDPSVHAGNAEIFGQDPGVAALSFGSVALWLLGRDKESDATSAKAMTLGKKLGRPSTLALATYFSAMRHQLRGDAVATRDAAETTMQLAADEGFTFWLAGGTILRGWADAMLGQIESGLAQIRGGIDTWLATGSRTYRTYHLGLLADILLRQPGRAAEAIRTLDEGLAAARDLPEGLYEAELNRLKGCALLQSRDKDAHAEAERYFTNALAISYRQEAEGLSARIPGTRDVGTSMSPANRRPDQTMPRDCNPGA